jgi:hypothetical protein
MTVPKTPEPSFFELASEPQISPGRLFTIRPVRSAFVGSRNRWEPRPECNGNRHPLFTGEPGSALAQGRFA